MLISHPELGIANFSQAHRRLCLGSVQYPGEPKLCYCTAVEGMQGRASDYGAGHSSPHPSRPLKCTLISSLGISCADLLRQSLVPLGCPPASPAHPRECPRPGGAGQAPETSPSCCAQFQGSQGLAQCPRRLLALAPAFSTSWKNPRGPIPTHSPACLKPPPRPPLVTSPTVRCTLKLEPVSCKAEPLTTGPRNVKT